MAAPGGRLTATPIQAIPRPADSLDRRRPRAAIPATSCQTISGEAMSQREQKKTLHVDQGLELMMRDALSGMEELACFSTHWPWACDLEIISIERPEFEWESRMRRH